MLQTVKNRFGQLAQFVKHLAEDPRIPPQDKATLVALVALIISPVDLIPDWIPILGQIDDLIVLALILDYFFRVLDQDLILSHYPWSLKSFVSMKRISRFISFFAPRALKSRLWKYTGSPYR